jgi:nucleotide sugar dehydrogenase
MKIAIIGKGFVGTAVSEVFPNVEQLIVDPLVKGSYTIEGALNERPQFVFVCVPTPPDASGDADVSAVDEVLSEIARKANIHDTPIVVIKSTVPPSYFDDIEERFYLDIVHNPEFLREHNYSDDMVNSNMVLLGGDKGWCKLVSFLYTEHSIVKPCPHIITDLHTAALVKYTINSYLATKVVFFNELYNVYSMALGKDADWDTFVEIMKLDPRIGTSHMDVPGHDGERGFGGKCFPKDTDALLYYADKCGESLEVLRTAVHINRELRKGKTVH